MILPCLFGIIRVGFCLLLASLPSFFLLGCQAASASKPEKVPAVSTVHNADFAIKPPAASANDDVDKPNHCKVFDIVDGDTFTCDFNHDGVITRKTEKVRMLYIDTPEIHHSKRNPSGQPQPFSTEAKAYTSSQVLGKIVYLRYDVNPQDRYGRKLALVYTVDPAKQKSVSVNEQLLLEGLATTMMIKPNLTCQAHMKALETQALDAKKGVWSVPLDF
jgi:micrococcal nuclease